VGPKLRRSESLKKIKSAAKVFMTLHDGSGTDNEDFRKAIAAGINVIHINTELRVAWRRGLEVGPAKHPEEVKSCRMSWNR
jgi:fructose-bisphosphate aldolase class II